MYVRYQAAQDRAYSRASAELRKHRNERAKVENGFVQQQRREAQEIRAQPEEERRQVREIRRENNEKRRQEHHNKTIQLQNARIEQQHLLNRKLTATLEAESGQAALPVAA